MNKQSRQAKDNRKVAEKRLSDKVEEIKKDNLKESISTYMPTIDCCHVCGAKLDLLCTCSYNFHYHDEY